MFARLMKPHSSRKDKQHTNGGNPAGIPGITVAATEGVHNELSAFFAAPETRYLATFAGVVMPMEKKKGQKTGKRLRGTQVVRTQDRLQSHSPFHGLAMTN